MSNKGGDLIGRIIGMLVFLIGVALLVIVFYKAFNLFTAKPADALGLTFYGDPKRDPSAALIGTRFGGVLIQIALLFIMAIAASLLSQKGINLYFSALQGHPISLGAKPQPAPTPPVSEGM